MNKKKLEIGSSHFWKNSESGNLVKCGKSLAYSYIPCTDASWPASYDDADTGTPDQNDRVGPYVPSQNRESVTREAGGNMARIEDMMHKMMRRSMKQSGELQTVSALTYRVESETEVQIEERLGVEALAAAMMNFDSDENGLVQRSTDPIDGPSIHSRTVNGVRRSQKRALEAAAWASSFVPVRIDVSTTLGAIRVADNTTDGAILVGASTTEGDPSVDLAGSGKPDPSAS
uniref:Late blight resistance protein n=1 Tax=Solanum tuberosum TaxID=4113 RepID=M1DLA3_SOLTU